MTLFSLFLLNLLKKIARTFFRFFSPWFEGLPWQNCLLLENSKMSLEFFEPTALICTTRMHAKQLSKKVMAKHRKSLEKKFKFE